MQEDEIQDQTIAYEGKIQDDILDIAGPVGLKWYEERENIITGGLILCILLIGWGIWMWLKRNKKNIQAFVNPYLKAKEELLKASELVYEIDDKALSLMLSDTVRQYLEEELSMPAPERTTEEFLKEMQENGFMQGRVLALLEDFLKLCDLAKFAQHSMDNTERRELYLKASQFIDLIHEEQQKAMRESVKKT